MKVSQVYEKKRSLSFEIFPPKKDAELDNIDETLLVEQPFTQQAAVQTEIDKQDFRKEKPVDKAFRQLFASIIGQWQQRIEQHAEANPKGDPSAESLIPASSSLFLISVTFALS